MFRLGGGSVAFYWHLQRPAQHVVVGNGVLSHQHQELAPGCVFRGDFARRCCVPHQINCVIHFHRYVIGDGIRRVLSGSRMRLNLSNGGYLPLRRGLAKRRKRQQTQSKYSVSACVAFTPPVCSLLLRDQSPGTNCSPSQKLVLINFDGNWHAKRRKRELSVPVRLEFHAVA